MLTTDDLILTVSTIRLQLSNKCIDMLNEVSIVNICPNIYIKVTDHEVILQTNTPLGNLGTLTAEMPSTAFESMDMEKIKEILGNVAKHVTCKTTREAFMAKLKTLFGGWVSILLYCMFLFPHNCTMRASIYFI